MAPELSWIDSHCHLDAVEFDADRDQVVLVARQAGVAGLVVPAVSADGFAKARQVVARYPGCALALGLHPIYLDRHQPDDLWRLRAALQRGGVVAVGEIGLDGLVPGLDMARQEALLVAQLQLAAEFGLPVLLHIRRAQDRVLKYLRAIRVPGGIAHAFNGSLQQAQAFIQLGFRLGFGGALTFERAQRIRELARSVPLDSLVLETDAPDMSPSWCYRQRNSPAELPAIAAALARLRDLPLPELAAATSANLRAALRLPADWPPPAG